MVLDVSRRQVLGAAAAAAFGGRALGGAALGGAAFPAPALAGIKRARGASRPNVLFVPIDDMNDWNGWLGGYPGVKTPNLDRLASLASGFTRAYTPAPACQPARAAVLFGVEPFKTGVYTNKSDNWTSTSLRSAPSLVRAFRDGGYATIGTGKVFHRGWRDESDGPAQNDQSAWTRYEFLSELRDKSKSLDWGPRGVTPETEDVARARWMADNVLSKSHDKPFFAAFGVRKPHLSWFVPQEWFDRYPIDGVRYPPGALDRENLSIAENEDDRDLGAGGKAMVRQAIDDTRKVVAGKGWRSAVQAYLAAISLADHAVGVLLDGLLSGPNASNTIVVVWSDHGWQLGEKLAWHKFTLWERATRVPLIVGGPGLRQGATDALISSVDLYPTLADLAGIEAPETLDGVSFASFLRGEAAPPRDHVVSTWALDVGEGRGSEGKHFAVRSATHRLIAYGDGGRELYDHRSDPWEWNNLLASRSSAAASDQIVADLERNVPKRAVPEAGGNGDDGDD